MIYMVSESATGLFLNFADAAVYDGYKYPPLNEIACALMAELAGVAWYEFTRKYPRAAREFATLHGSRADYSPARISVSTRSLLACSTLNFRT